MFKLLSLTLLFLTHITFATTLPKVQKLLDDEMTRSFTPAIAVAVIASGKVIHISSNGFSDLENKKQANINTAFHIASVSKTVTSMAVFQLLQSGKIKLNDDINKHLPLKVINPHHPKDNITIGELLNHSSGILDDEIFYLPYWATPNGDPKIRLNTFLKDYLTKEGKHYKDTHFESAERYKVYDYSNTGYALLGLLVEYVSGERFENYMLNKIFIPIKMENSAYLLKDLNSENISKTYSLANGKQTFQGFNGYPDYPAGLLRTSIADYARLITGYLNSETTPFILNEKMVNLITPPFNKNNEDHSYTWFLRQTNENWYYQHGGADLGARAKVIIDINNANAIIIFTNSELNLTPLMEKIESSIFNTH